MSKVRYIGKKDQRADTVAGTGIVWLGYGDEREVPDAAVPRLLKHPDVWELVELTASQTGLVNTTNPTAALSSVEILVGTSKQPAHIDIGGEQVQLGTVVSLAFKASGATVAQWNAPDAQEARDWAIDEQIKFMSGQAEKAAADKLAGEKPAAVEKAEAPVEASGQVEQPPADDATPKHEPLTAEQLAAFDDAAVRKLAELRGLPKPHHKKTGAALREAVLESQAAALKG